MFKRMTVYTVHLKPEATLSSQKPIFLREGFNFAAFLVPVVWALYRRLWFIAVLLAGWEVMLMFVVRSTIIDTPGILVLNIGMHVIVGFAANDWLRSRLSKKGYVFSDVAIADSRLRAQQRYFDRCFAA